MTDAMQFQTVGGPEVMKLTGIELPNPGPNEVRLLQTAIGLNYIDIYHRSGFYPMPLPGVPGLEAAGIVDQVGAQVTAFKPGDRVVYGRGPLGAYATERNIAAEELVLLPEKVSDKTAASVMLKGLTAWYLLHQTFTVRSGDTILVQAAAGGVGLLLCQWAKMLGCRVIGTVGSPEKAVLAKTYGCEEVILYRTEDVAARVRALTEGAGVPVVYDAVGQATFTASLDALQPFGMLVSYGQASGPIPPFDLSELARRGSLYVTRPSMTDYMRDTKLYHKAATDLLALVAVGKLTVTTAQTFALKDAAAAHRALENRETVGSTVLLP